MQHIPEAPGVWHKPDGENQNVLEMQRMDGPMTQGCMVGLKNGGAEGQWRRASAHRAQWRAPERSSRASMAANTTFREFVVVRAARDPLQVTPGRTARVRRVATGGLVRPRAVSLLDSFFRKCVFEKPHRPGCPGLDGAS